MSYLVGKSQAKLDLFPWAQSQSIAALGLSRGTARCGAMRVKSEGVLTATCLVVDGLGVASSLQRGPDGSRTRSESCTGNAEGVHDDVVGQLMCTASSNPIAPRRSVVEPASNFPNLGAVTCKLLSQCRL